MNLKILPLISNLIKIKIKIHIKNKIYYVNFHVKNVTVNKDV